MVKVYNITNLRDFLIDYGLTEKQASIYLAALKLGKSSMQQIAAEAKMQRTNAYDATAALITKGLLSIFPQGKKKLLVAESPAILRKIIREKEDQLEAVIPQLESLGIGAEHKPRILYYPGIEGYKHAYEDTLSSKEKKLVGIYSVQDTWDVVGRAYADRMVERRAKAGISLRVIRSKEKDVGFVYPSGQDLREMRHAPVGMVFPITTYVYDNKVVILSSKNETFGLLIESEDIAKAHRNYFDALWQISA